jgi:hypothetical protein
MRQIGRELEEAWLESTALQNVGVMEVMRGRNDSARGFIKESVDLRLAIGELFSGASPHGGNALPPAVRLLNGEPSRQLIESLSASP